MNVFEPEARAKACPFMGFDACLGSGCMAWRWHGPDYERVETDNLIETPDGLRPDNDVAPPMPEGDGWEKSGPETAKGYHRSAKDNLPKGRAQTWLRQIEQTRGGCGKIGGYW